MADPTLDAVNYLLGLLGSNPVSTLANPHPSTTRALERLLESSTDVQKEGWWFNKEYHFVVEPDSAGDIIIQSNTLSVTVESINAVVKRGNKLYNTITHSYAFTEPVTFNAVLKIDFDLLDVVVQDTIKYFAGIKVCEFDLEDSLKASKVEKFYTKAQTDMKKIDMRTQRRNILATPAVRRARSRVKPYKSNSSGRNPLIPGG